MAGHRGSRKGHGPGGTARDAPEARNCERAGTSLVADITEMTEKALDALKSEARRRAREQRTSGQSVSDAASRLTARLVGGNLIDNGSVVSAFWPLADEIDTRPAMTRLHERGCTVALPVMQGAGRPLLFRRWAPGDELVAADFGTREPQDDKPLCEPEVLLVPMLAFDRAGFRLGYGGGFYDRTLALLRDQGGVTAIGIAYACQELAEVPHGPFDQRLDWIVTERETIPTGG